MEITLPGGEVVFPSAINSCLSYLARIHCSFNTLRRESLWSTVSEAPFSHRVGASQQLPGQTPQDCSASIPLHLGLILCWGKGKTPVFCQMSSGITGLYPLDASSTLSPLPSYDTPKCLQILPVPPWGKIFPPRGNLKTTASQPSLLDQPAPLDHLCHPLPLHTLQLKPEESRTLFLWLAHKIWACCTGHSSDVGVQPPGTCSSPIYPPWDPRQVA